ncbi:MAG: ribonuclease H-like domain-containing protein [Candidatus Staskawiczbacteria bacterium]|jgi:uncharacterized protein YprB with RNaseH-like and TPR domain
MSGGALTQQAREMYKQEDIKKGTLRTLDNFKQKRYIVFDIETTGLYPTNSRITCICAKSISGNDYQGSHTNEQGLIKDFLNWVESENCELLISANGKSFDSNFILVRAYLNNLLSSYGIDFAKLEHFDIINDITDKMISLNNLARVYNLNLKSGSGVNAIKLWEEMKLNELMNYCMNDVILTENVYLKYMEIKNGK